MEKLYPYSGMADRKIKVTEAESLGLRMIQDNFTKPDWHHGDKIEGVMTFDDSPCEPKIRPPKRNMLAELEKLEARVKALEELEAKNA